LVRASTPTCGRSRSSLGWAALIAGVIAKDLADLPSRQGIGKDRRNLLAGHLAAAQAQKGVGPRLDMAPINVQKKGRPGGQPIEIGI
jgi:hypothetical protein